MGFRFFSRVGLLLQPADQRVHPVALQTAFGVDQFRKVQQIGEAAFAIHQAQQISVMLTLQHPLPEHRHKPLRVPDLMPTVKGFQLGFQQRRGFIQRKQTLGSKTKQLRDQCLFQSRFIARFGNRP